MNTKLQSDVNTPHRAEGFLLDITQNVPPVVAVSAWDSFLDENRIGDKSRDQDAC